MSSFIKSALAALALTAAPAALAEKPVVQHVTVTYADLNLQSEAGISTLLSRLSSATRKSCGGRPVHSTIGAWDQLRACRAVAMDKAVRSIGIPNVIVAWAEMRGEPIQTASR